MTVRSMLLHRMALFSFRLFCTNLGNLQECFGQIVYRHPWPKIARTPMFVGAHWYCCYLIELSPICKRDSWTVCDN